MTHLASTTHLEEKPRPVSEGQRIDDIDVLRGMALCGVLVSNLVEMFRAPWGHAFHVPGSGRIDAAVDALMSTAFQGNTITLTFSAIFGLGMAIGTERIANAGASAYRFLVRKQLVLLAIGLFHATLIWFGDVLSNYAFVGLFALAFLRCRPRTLLVVAFIAAVIFCLPIYPTRPPATSPEALARAAETLDAYQKGSWWDVHAQRLSDLRFIYRYSAARWYIAELMAFCLGMAAWRSGILTAPEKHRRALWGALLAGIVSLTVIVLNHVGYLPTVRSFSNAPVRRFFLTFGYHTAYTELGFAYCAGILLLLRTATFRRWLLLIAPLGQMALSNYLMQSIVFGFVFYGYGLGQYGKQTTAITAAGGLAFYALQVCTSRLWLQRFRFGPVEWFWRSLSYGKMQPLRKGARLAYT